MERLYEAPVEEESGGLDSHLDAFAVVATAYWEPHRHSDADKKNTPPHVVFEVKKKNECSW